MKKIELQLQWLNKSYRLKKFVITVFSESDNALEEIQEVIDEVNHDIPKILVENMFEVNAVCYTIIVNFNELKEYLLSQWNGIKVS